MAKTAKKKAEDQPETKPIPATNVKPKGERGVGDNSLEVPEVVKAKDEWLKLDEEKKAIGKAQSAIAAQMKEQYRISKGNWAQEMKFQKMALDTRIQFESQAHDLKGMLGYQASLDLRQESIARTEDEHLDPSAAAGKFMNKKH